MTLPPDTLRRLAEAIRATRFALAELRRTQDDMAAVMKRQEEELWSLSRSVIELDSPEEPR